MSSNVFRVILNDLSAQNDTANILGSNHSIESGHLPDGVREKENLLSRGFDNCASELALFLYRHGLCRSVWIRMGYTASSLQRPL